MAFRWCVSADEKLESSSPRARRCCSVRRSPTRAIDWGRLSDGAYHPRPPPPPHPSKTLKPDSHHQTGALRSDRVCPRRIGSIDRFIRLGASPSSSSPPRKQHQRQHQPPPPASPAIDQGRNSSSESNSRNDQFPPPRVPAGQDAAEQVVRALPDQGEGPHHPRAHHARAGAPAQDVQLHRVARQEGKKIKGRSAFGCGGGGGS